MGLRDTGWTQGKRTKIPQTPITQGKWTQEAAHADRGANGTDAGPSTVDEAKVSVQYTYPYTGGLVRPGASTVPGEEEKEGGGARGINERVRKASGGPS